MKPVLALVSCNEPLETTDNASLVRCPEPPEAYGLRAQTAPSRDR